MLHKSAARSQVIVCKSTPRNCIAPDQNRVVPSAGQPNIPDYRLQKMGVYEAFGNLDPEGDWRSHSYEAHTNDRDAIDPATGLTFGNEFGPPVGSPLTSGGFKLCGGRKTELHAIGEDGNPLVSARKYCQDLVKKSQKQDLTPEEKNGLADCKKVDICRATDKKWSPADPGGDFDFREWSVGYFFWKVAVASSVIWFP